MIELAIGVIRVYELLLIIRIIASWVQRYPSGDMMRMLYQITEPYLDLFRKALPFLAAGGIDFSPIVGFFALDFLARFLMHAL